MRYAGPVFKKVTRGSEKYIGLARTMLGQLETQIKLSNGVLTQSAMKKTLPDGTKISVGIVGGQYYLNISAVFGEAEVIPVIDILYAWVPAYGYPQAIIYRDKDTNGTIKMYFDSRLQGAMYHSQEPHKISEGESLLSVGYEFSNGYFHDSTEFYPGDYVFEAGYTLIEQTGSSYFFGAAVFEDYYIFAMVNYSTDEVEFYSHPIITIDFANEDFTTPLIANWDDCVLIDSMPFPSGYRYADDQVTRCTFTAGGSQAYFAILNAHGYSQEEAHSFEYLAEFSFNAVLETVTGEISGYTDSTIGDRQIDNQRPSESLEGYQIEVDKCWGKFAKYSCHNVSSTCVASYGEASAAASACSPPPQVNGYPIESCSGTGACGSLCQIAYETDVWPDPPSGTAQELPFTSSYEAQADIHTADGWDYATEIWDDDYKIAAGMDKDGNIRYVLEGRNNSVTENGAGYHQEDTTIHYGFGGFSGSCRIPEYTAIIEEQQQRQPIPENTPSKTAWNTVTDLYHNYIILPWTTIDKYYEYTEGNALTTGYKWACQGDKYYWGDWYTVDCGDGCNKYVNHTYWELRSYVGTWSGNARRERARGALLDASVVYNYSAHIKATYPDDDGLYGINTRTSTCGPTWYNGWLNAGNGDTWPYPFIGTGKMLFWTGEEEVEIPGFTQYEEGYSSLWMVAEVEEIGAMHSHDPTTYYNVEVWNPYLTYWCSYGYCDLIPHPKDCALLFANNEFLESNLMREINPGYAPGNPTPMTQALLYDRKQGEFVDVLALYNDTLDRAAAESPGEYGGYDHLTNDMDYWGYNWMYDIKVLGIVPDNGNRALHSA